MSSMLLIVLLCAFAQVAIGTDYARVVEDSFATYFGKWDGAARWLASTLRNREIKRSARIERLTQELYRSGEGMSFESEIQKIFFNEQSSSVKSKLIELIQSAKTDAVDYKIPLSVGLAHMVSLGVPSDEIMRVIEGSAGRVDEKTESSINREILGIWVVKQWAWNVIQSDTAESLGLLLTEFMCDILTFISTDPQFVIEAFSIIRDLLTQKCLHGDSTGGTQDQSCGVVMRSILKKFNASVLVGIAKDKSILTRLKLSSSLTKLRGGVQMSSIEKLNYFSSLVRGELSPGIDVPSAPAALQFPTPIRGLSSHHMQLMPESGDISSLKVSLADKVVPLSSPSKIEMFLETAVNDDSVGISVRTNFEKFRDLALPLDPEILTSLNTQGEWLTSLSHLPATDRLAQVVAWMISGTFIVDGDWGELLNMADKVLTIGDSYVIAVEPFFKDNKRVYETLRNAVAKLSLTNPELTQKIVSLIRDLVQTDRTVSSITVTPATESPEDTLIAIIFALRKRSDDGEDAAVLMQEIRTFLGLQPQPQRPRRPPPPRPDSLSPTQTIQKYFQIRFSDSTLPAKIISPVDTIRTDEELADFENTIRIIMGSMGSFAPIIEEQFRLINHRLIIDVRPDIHLFLSLVWLQRLTATIHIPEIETTFRLIYDNSNKLLTDPEIVESFNTLVENISTNQATIKSTQATHMEYAVGFLSRLFWLSVNEPLFKLVLRSFSKVDLSNGDNVRLLVDFSSRFASLFDANRSQLPSYLNRRFKLRSTDYSSPREFILTKITKIEPVPYLEKPVEILTWFQNKLL